MPLRTDDAFLPQLERYRQAGFSVVSLNVGFDQFEWHQTFRILAYFRRWIEQHSQDYVLVDSVVAFKDAQRTDKLAIFFDIEGGCQDADSGLTEFSKQALAEMARVGMVACCSHVGQRTALEAMEYSTNPVILSHSNPRAMWDHPRNVRDEVMKACAATGGMGLNGIGIFLGNNEATARRFVEHLDYAVQLIGPDHVGLGVGLCL